MSLLSNLLDLIVPRRCCACGKRLTASEPLLCIACDMKVSLTHYESSPYDNPMARLFWAQFPIEKASAWIHFIPHGEMSGMIYDLKYHNRPDLGEAIGERMAIIHQRTHFFDDIDAIIPVPITRSRRLQRGYNQSDMVARGISRTTGLPIYNNVVKQQQFKGSQTNLNAWERQENVNAAFLLTDSKLIENKHLLIVDDITTTGATIIACGKQLAKASGVRISVLTIGHTKE